jgi:hypothetical protein
MRYARPAIEERVEVRALLGLNGISGGPADVFTQPIWRSARSRKGRDEAADRD